DEGRQQRAQDDAPPHRDEPRAAARARWLLARRAQRGGVVPADVSLPGARPRARGKRVAAPGARGARKGRRLMPRLARLRLVSVGHPSARFGDLVLDFRDSVGRATDATLWLRNGGGKSSLLNLFFALVRPDRREFLGNRAEAKQRRL